MKLVRVFFSKKDRAKYISHLDLTRCLTRAFVRTDIPIWFTEGFNPHIYMTFALPIPLGVEGERESFDCKITDDAYPLTNIPERLNRVLPGDIRALEALEAREKPGEIAYANYRIELFSEEGPQALCSDWDKFLSRPEILVEKRTKHLVKEVDLRPMIEERGRMLGEESLTLELRLPAGSTLNLSPNLLLDAFWKDRGGEAQYGKLCRTAILTGKLQEFA